ncbi:uncharacterized protein LOC143083453 [Mytilus galloprovincialis]|uniref:uncharacterized protein LOC143083453 n=1 Tax=Mytilus galloprovincialis TaxID=29158 RepID=UPI003F7C0CFC
MSIEVDPKNTSISDRMAFVLGYTGETGKALVKELSKRKVFRKVMLIGRREVQFEKDLGPEFEQKVVDFDRLNDYKHDFQDLDTGFCCIGTSKAKSGGKAGFIKVDHDYEVNSAAMAKSVGCNHFVLVSSYGANKDSSFLYIKTKGQVEEDLKAICFDNLSIFRPGMLLCERVERRPIEACIRFCWKPMPRWFVKEGAINTDDLAAAMVNKALTPSPEKGQVEEDLKAICFDNLSIFRPGMLLCERVERRPIEACIRFCWKPMPRWFVKEGAINTDDLAAAMVNKALTPSPEKGQVEEDLKAICFDNLSIFRPGMLLCERVERRPIEACIRFCWKPMPRWFVKEGAINTDDLAAAMVNKALTPSPEKGQVEEDLKAICFDNLSIFRPGMLLCERVERRPIEACIRFCWKPMPRWFVKEGAINTDDLAAAMVNKALTPSPEKGQVEEDLKAICFDNLSIFRPGMLLCERVERRPIEACIRFCWKPMPRWFVKEGAINTDDLAAAMVNKALTPSPEKGQVEEDLKAICFDNLSIFRPGMLLCERVERRPIEACIRFCWKPMPRWFVKEGAINTDDLAAAMVNKALTPSPEKGMAITTVIMLLAIHNEICVSSIKENNIAFGKPTKQLTTVNPWTSEHAVDGNYIEFTSSEFECTHTKAYLNTELSWWAVDLGGYYKVTHVVLTGRTHTCCTQWLQNYDIDVIKDPQCFCDKWGTFQKGMISHCHYQQTSTTYLNASCPPDVKGRFVRIKKRSHDYQLSLCEVEVYGDLITNIISEENHLYKTKAYGFPGKVYNGLYLQKMVARSIIECTNQCIGQIGCCAGMYNKVTKECSLMRKSDNNEETTHSFHEDDNCSSFLI